jgi:hypothetical protein
MALVSTQPLTEMSTRNIPGGEGRPARKADNLTAIYEPIVYKMWEPQHLTALWVSTVQGYLYLYLYSHQFLQNGRHVSTLYYHLQAFKLTISSGFIRRNYTLHIPSYIVN